MLGAADKPTAFRLRSGGVSLLDYGLTRGQVTFLPFLNGTNQAAAFDVPNNDGLFVQSLVGFPTVVQQEVGRGTGYAARVRSHTSALGQRFRLAGFANDQSNGDDAGFGYLGVFAPQDCNVVATLPPHAYARFVAGQPNANFWRQKSGPPSS